MRRVSRLLAIAVTGLLFASSASAQTGTVGVDAGVMAWQKAAAHVPLATVGLSADLGLTRVIFIGAELRAAHVAETNRLVSQRTWPITSALTVNAHLSRQALSVGIGVGPAFIVAPSRIHSQGIRYGGTYARVGLRLRGQVAGPVYQRLGWRLTGGTIARQDGLDWDATAALTLRFGAQS